MTAEHVSWLCIEKEVTAIQPTHTTEGYVVDGDFVLLKMFLMFVCITKTYLKLQQTAVSLSSFS